MAEETPEQVPLDDLLPLGYVQKRGDATSQICTRCGALVWVSEDDERTEAEEIHSQWHAAIEDLTITVQVEDGRQLTIDHEAVKLGPQGSNMLRIPFTPEQRRELVVALGLDPNRADDCTWPAIMVRVRDQLTELAERRAEAGASAPHEWSTQDMANTLANQGAALQRLREVVLAAGCPLDVNVIDWIEERLNDLVGGDQREAALVEANKGLCKERDRLRAELGSDAALTQTDQPLRDQLIQQLKDTSINHPAAVVDLLMPVIGVWRGEVERLRRIEDALVAVGAPNRSERGDPGGLTVAWIQRQAELMSELRAKDQAAKQAVKLLAERPTQDAYVLALEEPERCRSGLVEALGLDQNTGFYAALDVVREYVAERSSTVTTVDTGGHRVTVHMDPALPEDWQQQVATVIEQAEDAASEIVTRIAYWLGVGKVHTCEAHCSLEHVEEGLDNTKPVTDQVLSDLLLLVNVTVTPEQLAAWTLDQREQAANWAGLVHLDASDNDVDVPERPAFLDGPAENTGTPGAPITGFTAPEVAAERREWAAEQFEVCSSLYLHGGTLVSCKAIWEHDRHQNTPTGSGDVVWFDHQAVPSPWPVDQEPPAGITLLADTGAGETLGYLCRVAKHWVWSDKPAIPHSPYQMLPWAEAVLDADGDLIVVRP